ncbi:hypothetical protein DFH11DRAFT_1724631 [Phellopilus nigrolimitatus]|nr:hypothetical protein DFH11DRAFT_1724631 [Phellopilus nigrolimitatus]
MTACLSSLPYISFLTAYPHPAFIVCGKSQRGHAAPALDPVFGNPAFRLLLFGPDADTAELGHSFLEALETVQQAEKFALWLDRARNNPKHRQETLVVHVRPSWTPLDAEPVQLELSQTIIDEYTVCSSTPRSPLPKLEPVITVPSPTFVTRFGRDFGMRLPDFPPSPAQMHANPATMTPTTFSALVRTPQGSGQSSRSPDRLFEGLTRKPEGGMKEMIENYDWHLTPLGPRSAWGSSLCMVVNYILANPFPLSIWWGPELVLLYNDAYKEMADHKHPHIFAKHGSVSWAELWESIGPLVTKVFHGEAVAKRDDLLFINRMTETKLPEETYHSWSWVPIEEDGIVKGFVNSTFESTSKIITERRMLILRELANKAGLARTQAEFVDAVINELQPFVIDCPFAAFYTVSVKDGPATNSNKPRTSYIHKSVGGPPIKIELRRAGTVGVPNPHPSVPEKHELFLDPLTLRPSSKTRLKNGSPAPSSRSHDSSSDSRASTSTSSTAVPTVPGSSPSGSASSRSTEPRALSAPSTFSVTSVDAASATAVQKIPESAVIWPFAEAFSSRRPVHVPAIPDYVVEGFELRGWGEHAREAIVIPIVVDDAEIPSAVVVLGLNSRRPYDDDYAGWIDLLRISLNSLLTAVKGREADLIRAEHLAELDSAKTAFFSNASHELRTPLTLIQGPLEDSIANLGDSKVKDNLVMASRNVVRLARLVDSLMDFSKLAANKLEGRFRPVQLGEYTSDLATLFRSTIEKSEIEYVVDCDRTDRRDSFWEKILFNLIGNAFKYTMRGSIHVMLKYDKEHVHFHVKDTGVGIPQSDIHKVFNRFHRVDAISRSHEGTGIGLALTKELVRLHRGNLTVSSFTEGESPDNHGSCFTIVLPLGKDHLPEGHIVQDNADAPQHRLYARGIVDEATQWSWRPPDLRTPSESSDSGGSSESGKMDPTTLFFVKSDVVLLVDDNADMRRYIKSLFDPFCQVAEASNGQEALNLLDEIKPNLILSDVMMPILDGYGLIAHVRRRSDTRLTPIILVTAKESEEARVEGLLSGADDYMSKPFTGKELIARVHLQMQLGKRRIELEAKFLADHNREILYVNPRWYEISGHDPSVSVDLWPDCVQEEDQKTVEDLWRASFESQKSASLEFRFKNGTYAKWSLQPLLASSGALAGLISTITDVSDHRLYEASRLAHAQEREALARKRAEEAEERRKEADERRRGQELLIDVTSHELRQPVSAILNCSSLVRSNLASHRDELSRNFTDNELYKPTEAMLDAIDDDLEALDAIYQCGLAQERIANDVLSLSRIQLQILSIHPVEFELIAEIQGIISIFRNELKMKRINLNLSFGDSFKKLGVTRVSSDKSRFGQVMTNLLSNGIKFTDTSSNKREISVTVNVSRRAPAPGGPCVPPGDLNEDEDPLDADTPSKIFVFVAVQDSGPGFQQGSEVTTAPPLPQELDQLDRHAGDYPFTSTRENGGEGVEASKPLHILITEDNLINQTVLKRQLLKAGCTTTLANNGLQAIEKIRSLAISTGPSRAFDAVLMDCEMPVMDGLTAVREIRKLEEVGEFPIRNRIFALTGNARAGQIQSARDAGMDEVILSAPDIVLSHDWPRGIEQYGNTEDLLRRKPYFRSDIQTGALGNPPAMQLLKKLRPPLWFSAHLHCKFEATVVHEGSQAPVPAKGDNPDEIAIDDFDDAESATDDKKTEKPAIRTNAPVSEANPDEILLDEEMEEVAPPPAVPRKTKFLALDKCLPRRHYLEVVEVPSVESPETPRLTYDPEWLAITRAFHPYLSTARAQPRLPDATRAAELVTKELEWVMENVGDKESRDGLKDIRDCQVFWPTAPGPGNEGPNRFRPPPWYTNPQTEAFCGLLQLENKVNPVPKGVKFDPPQVPVSSESESNTPQSETKNPDKYRADGRAVDAVLTRRACVESRLADGNEAFWADDITGLEPSPSHLCEFSALHLYIITSLLHILSQMPSTTATTTATKKSAESQPNGQHASENGAKSVAKVAAAAEREPAGAGHEKEEDMLRAYSKELYVYTLDLLNAVRIDEATKKGGKAFLLKRTISDIGVPLKTEPTKGTSAKDAAAA